MSSTEPPSRIPPRNQNHDTKANRNELSSKGKVEKVREVDADETRKRKFQKYYDDDQTTEVGDGSQKAPSPFDLCAQSEKQAKPSLGASESSHSSIGGVEDAIVSSPSYSPPPDVSSPQIQDNEDDGTEGALPQSEGFWENVDSPPDQPIPPQQLQESPDSLKRAGFAPPPSDKKINPISNSDGKKKDSSPFGPPGKPIGPEKKGMETPSNAEEKKKLPSPFEQAASSKKGEREYQGQKNGKIETKSPKEKAKEEGYLTQGTDSLPITGPERDLDHEQREKEQKAIQIELSNHPSFPSNIQAAAIGATVQSAPYIHPSTVSLFFQMVGTMYVMANPGVNRTEIVLNNAAYANSKFYGATITIEKYATAPDSFNIKLTGTDRAVAAFKENIPSLLNAFQNGNFTFRVNRLDVEYNADRPVYRRKEKDEDRGDAGGGDLGERRK